MFSSSAPRACDFRPAPVARPSRRLDRRDHRRHYEATTKRRDDGRGDDDGRDGDGREMREMRAARVDVVRRASTRARGDDALGDDDDDDDDGDDGAARGDSRLARARAR